MPVRPILEREIQQAADLYWNFLCERNGHAPPAACATFRELFFTSPLVDPAHPTIVYEKDGKIVGLLSIIARKMSLNGRLVRVGFGGNLVDHPEARSGLAAARLIGAYTTKQFDLCQTDSTNAADSTDCNPEASIPSDQLGSWIRSLQHRELLSQDEVFK